MRCTGNNFPKKRNKIINCIIQVLNKKLQQKKDFYIFVILKYMFVGSTFLGSVDRVSIKSVLTGKTGSFLGLLGSAAFIVICFILFIGPVIFYFKGDYVQGIFTLLNTEKLEMYSGCDYKLAISIYSKATGSIVNLNTLKQIIEIQTFYVSPDQDTFYASVWPCYPQYFAQMEDKPHEFQAGDCYIIPNGLGYFSEFVAGYTSVIGFIFKPVCSDPFVCTYGSMINGNITARRNAFFSEHYYVLRFTGNYMDQYGNLKKKFYQVYSTEWQTPNNLISQTWTVLETSKVYLDNSVMPWINNESLLYTNWYGQNKGRPLTQYTTQNFGVGVYIVAGQIQRIYFRQYKKLDWLLGMLGGGILLLYIIFWTVCNFISTTKQKCQTCQSTTLIRYNKQNVNDLYKPTFNLIWFVSNILPFNLPCFQQQNKIIHSSQKFLDIADLLKKLKTSVKNLIKNQYPVDFEPKILQIYQEPKNQTFSEQQIKNEMKSQILQQIKSDSRIPKIYEHHLPMLALCQNSQNQNVQNKIQQIMKDEIYSKTKVPKFQLKQKSVIIRVGKAIKDYTQKFITLFDAFGAKPNLSGGSESFSIFGCVLTLIIIILSILTFALTLKNMGVTRTNWDEIYVDPQKQHVQMTTGIDFKLAICFHQLAFDNNLVMGQDKVVNIKFYQYRRNGTTEEYKYYDVFPIRSDSSNYFDATTNMYQQVDQTYCFRPDNGLKVEVNGDPLSETQSYLGYKLTPYCSSTPATCASTRNDTIAKFFNLLNVYPIYFYLPSAQYFPDIKKVAINPQYAAFAPVVTATDLNFTKSIDQIVNVDTLQLIDDWASWTMGDFPKPRQQILTADFQSYQSKIDTSESSETYFNFKVALTGKVQRVIFTSYKIDFLFATIGGCFAFYFFFFGCFGKAYNAYNMKVKLAEQLYNQEPEGISGFKAFLNWMRIPCCKDQIIQKIQNDIDCVQLAKNVDNVYRLSVAKYNTTLEKNLGLIYLKQRIKEDETVVVEQKLSQIAEQEEEDDFELDWDAALRKQKKKLNPHSIQNISQTQQDHQIALEKQYGEIRKNIQNQPTISPEPTARSVEKCGSLVNKFDLFHNNAQFTLDGKRSVKSACGGLCCIILFVFICILTSHFLTVYFSDYHQLSLNKVSQQNSQKLKMSFEVGKNFKLAVSFYKMSQYNFEDVRNLTKNIGLSMIKYKTQRNPDSSLKTTTQTIDLISCPSDYLKGFLNEHQDPKYFANIQLAYCIPDGTTMDLYGSADDKIRQHFSIKMYNKYGSSNAVGLKYIKDFLASYLPLYHISTPTVDFRPDGKLRYSMLSVIKSQVYQTTTSRSYNITLTKNVVLYDTAVNPTNERPSFDTYKLKPYQNLQYYHGYPDDAGRHLELNFYTEDVYNQYVVKKIKVNEIFGIVGGCIVFLFFGLGILPRSYNQYKLRYKIGTKLYMIMGKKRAIKIKNTKGKPAQIKRNADEISSELSQWRLVVAWFFSFWGFLKNNYNTNQTLRLASLIQSKASNDINIFEFMKTLRAVQNGIKKMNLNEGSSLNLCRVYPKQIVPMTGDEDDGSGKELVKTVKDHYNDLIQASRVNKFTEWELNILIKAKENNVDISKIFNEKWLDKFMGINRSSMSSSTYMRSTINRSNSFKRSYLPSKEARSQQSANINQNQSSHLQLKQDEENQDRSQKIMDD